MVVPPSLAVSVANIPLNGIATLTYTITNPADNTVALTGVAFTDNFPAGLIVASANGLSDTCGGTAVAVAGSGSVSLAGATVAAGSSCMLTVNVTATAATVYNTGLTTVMSANGGTGNRASAQLKVLVPITLNTMPTGLTILVDGQNYTNGQMRYAFSNWSDGGAVVHAIFVPATPTTYTATFAT